MHVKTQGARSRPVWERSRENIVRNINRLAKDVLPALAQKDDEYPVQYDHCFLRIAYDNAVCMKWDTFVDRPFYKNATKEQLFAAYNILNAMVESPAVAKAYNNASLRYRR